MQRRDAAATLAAVEDPIRATFAPFGLEGTKADFARNRRLTNNEPQTLASHRLRHGLTKKR